MDKPPKTLVKAESTTNPKYGKTPNDRPIQEYVHKGFIILDKPAGPTSHQVTDWVKKIFGLEKAGHSGTLDPQVTGVLTIALGESTKVLQAIFGADKEYVCLMKLHGEVSSSQLKKILSQYRGIIKQKPPVKSAVKRVERERRIHRLELLERDGPYVLFKVLCEAGTYIRKLCHDMGQDLGVGAHMAQLRRTQAGAFSEDESIILHDLKDAWENRKNEGGEEKLRTLIHPMEEMMRDKPKIWVKDSAVDAICHGSKLNTPGIVKLTDNIKKDDLIALFTLKDELVGIGTAIKNSKEMMESKQGEAVKPKRIVMPADTYPKTWGNE